MKKTLYFLTLITLLLSSNLYANVLKIIYEKGTVTVTRSRKIIQTKEIFPADKITTGPNSLAILRGDRETLKIQADSEIVYQHGATTEDSTVILNLGGLISQINKKKFHVKMKSASLGVRGTQFFSSVDEKDKIWMCVNEGEVEVNDGHNTTLVPAGKGVSVINGEISKPQNLAWTKNVNWEMDPSKVTEEKKTVIESNHEAPSVYDEKKTNIDSSLDNPSVYDD